MLVDEVKIQRSLHHFLVQGDVPLLNLGARDFGHDAKPRYRVGTEPAGGAAGAANAVLRVRVANQEGGVPEVEELLEDTNLDVPGDFLRRGSAGEYAGVVPVRVVVVGDRKRTSDEETCRHVP